MCLKARHFLFAASWLVSLALSAQESANGELIYSQNCAGCHETELPLMPTRSALREYSPEAIDGAMTGGLMRKYSGSLTVAERQAVAEFLSGRPSGSYRGALASIPKSAYCSVGVTDDGNRLADPSWNGWSTDLANTRFQPNEMAGLTAHDVSRLKLKWAFGIPGVSTSGSQATVIGDRVYLGAQNGINYALDAETGCIVWTFEADSGVRAAPVVAQDTGDGSAVVFLGDFYAQVYALDAESGSLRWKVKIEDHPDARLTAAPAVHDGRLFMPVSSSEEASARVPTFQCCTFRGSIVALDTETGEQLWKTYMIDEIAKRTVTNSVGTQQWGPSGAAIWSAPTLDPEHNRLFVTTGDNYSDPPTVASDAIVALAMDTGRILWVQQTTPGDAWNTACLDNAVDTANCPESDGPDYDYGSSAALVRLENGDQALVAGQKSGVLYVLDVNNGKVIQETRISDGGVLGGIEWGFATDGVAAYVSISGAMEKGPGEAGGIAAVDINDGSILWHAPPAQDSCGRRQGCNTAQPGAVTAIPGAVISGSVDGHIRAYSTENGEVIWDFDTVRDYETVNGVSARGGALNGPGATIVDGVLYVNSGYGRFGFMPGNVLLAFSTD